MPKITAVQLKTYFLCLLLSFSSAQVLLSQIPSCCRPGGANFKAENLTMSCHGVPTADLSESSAKDDEVKDKRWRKKSTICHCRSHILSLLGVKPFYANQAVLAIHAPESYEVSPKATVFDSPTEVFMTLTTKPPIVLS